MLLAVVFILIYSKLAISKFVLVETEDEGGDGNDDGILEDNEFEAKNRKVGQDLRYKQIKNRSWGSSPTINNSWEWKCKGQFGRRRKRETFNNKFDL